MNTTNYITNCGKLKVTVEQVDGSSDPIVIEFENVAEFSVDNELVEKESPAGFQTECRSTTIKLKGRLAGTLKHEHKWKLDSFGPTSEESDPLHYGLTCECGARACGTESLSEVHNVREYGA